MDAPHAAESVNALRGKAEMAHDRDASIDEGADLPDYRVAASELDRVGAAFLKVPDGVRQRLLGAGLLAAKWEVGYDERH